jgi:hypothetical protein
MSGADIRRLPVVGLLYLGHDTLADRLLVQLVVFLQPLRHGQADREIRLQLALEAGHVPLLLDAHGRDEAVDDLVDHVLADSRDGVGDVAVGEQVVALLIDDLALVVGDVVVFEELLADVEVAALDLALGLLDGVGDHGCSMASPFSMPSACMKFFTRSEAKMRIRLSSRDR